MRGNSQFKPTNTNIKHDIPRNGVCNVLSDAREIINNVLFDNNLEIMDVFEYGTRIIEFMVKKDNEIISISLVDDLSYDFTVFSEDGDIITYNNTQRLLLLDELKEIIQQDLKNFIKR